MSRLSKNKKQYEKGLAFIPILIWGAVTAVGGAIAWWGSKKVASKALGEFLASLFQWSADAIYYISKFLCFTAADIFDTALEVLNNTTGKWGITNNSAFVAGWISVRDFSNIFIVLGLVVVGIATTLRIRDYEAKKLLLPLIIMALLINFSGVFVGIIVDASNILTKGLISQGGAANVATEYYKMINNFSDKVFDERNIISDDPIEYFKATIIIVFIYLTVAATFIYLSVILIARYAVLGFLYVLSPLAFVCKVFPIKTAQTIWNEWWQNFLKWAFVGVGAALVLNISAGIMKHIGAENAMDLVLNQKSIEVTDIIVVLLFLVIGFMMVRKSSAMGASAVMGLAGGALGYAMGATKVGMKGLSNMTGLTRAGQGAKDVATRTLERMNLMDKGTTAMNQRKLLEGVSKGLEADYGNDEVGNAELAKIATQKAVSARARDQKTAAAELLAKRKAFGYIPEKQQEAVAAYATARGVAKETFTKDRPDLLTGVETKDAKEALLKEESARLEADPKLKAMAPHEREAEIEKGLKRYKSTMSGEAIDAKRRELAKAKKDERKLGAIPVTDADVEARALKDYKPTKGEIATEKTKIGPGATNEEAIKRLKSYYKPSTGTLLETRKKMVTDRAKEKTLDFKYATEEEARQNLIDKEAKRLKDDLGFSGSDLDAEIKAFGDSLTPDKIENGLADLNKERESKAIKKMGPAKLRELPESMIDANIVEHSDYKTLDRAYLEMTPEQKDKYKTLLPSLQSKVLSGLGLAAGSSIGKVKAEINKLKRSTSKADQEKGAKMEELANKYLLIKG